MGIRAIQDHVIVADMNFEERKTKGGVVLLGDDKTSDGIRPRWARVVAIGTKQKDVKVGQYVLIAHGRWTRGIQLEDEVIRRVDTDDILLVSDVPHIDESSAGSHVVTDQREKNIEDLYENF